VGWLAVTGLQITGDFSEPYFGGGGPETDDYSLPVSLDGRGFLLDLDNPYGLQFRRQSVQLLNTQQATQGGDLSTTPPEVWRRPVQSWHQGADQERLDREDSLPYRYHASVNIDPWEKFGFQLLPETGLLQATDIDANIFMKSIGESLLVVSDTDTWFYVTVDQIAQPHTLASVAVDLTCDGENFYVLCADGTIHRRSAAGVWSLFGTIPSFDPTRGMLQFVKGFLVAGNGPELIDMTSGVAVPVYTHRLPGWTWRSASEGLSVIYVLGGMGDRWHIFRISVKDSGSALNPPIVAATLPDGEFAYALATYLGFVMIGVNSGWRFGMPDSSGQITYGQLIETPGPVRCFEGQDRFVWFGLSIRAGQSQSRKVQDRTIYTGGAGLGRSDLSVFVSPMTPASASDLYGQPVGETVAIATIGGPYDGYGKRVFAVKNPGQAGQVWVEKDTLCQTGWLTSGTMAFNSTDQKMGLYSQVYHSPLRGKVTLDVADDTTLAWVEQGSNSKIGSVSMGNLPYPRAFNALEQRLTLERDPDDATLGPRIARMEFRAINIPGRATQWTIPLLVHEDTNYRNIEKNRDVESDYDYLISLVQTRRQFIYREGERTWNLHALDFTWVPYKMTSDSSTYQGTFMLVAREVQ
jgi:hypothetical protein